MNKDDVTNVFYSIDEKNEVGCSREEVGSISKKERLGGKCEKDQESETDEYNEVNTICDLFKIDIEKKGRGKRSYKKVQISDRNRKWLMSRKNEVRKYGKRSENDNQKEGGTKKYRKIFDILVDSEVAFMMSDDWKLNDNGLEYKSRVVEDILREDDGLLVSRIEDYESIMGIIDVSEDNNFGTIDIGNRDIISEGDKRRENV